MWMVTYGSSHFEFRAFGKTKADAKKNLWHTLNAHRNDYPKCEKNWYLGSDYDDKRMDKDEFLEHECNYLQFDIGNGFRDFDKINI